MNNGNGNSETEASNNLSRLQANEFGVNASNNIATSATEVHNIRAQNAPLVQHSLDNTSITIEEIVHNHMENLEFTNGTNTENIMGQYARFLRESVAEVTRSRLGNIMAVSRQTDVSRQNTTGIVTQSSNYNRLRSLPTSFGSLNSVLRPDLLRQFSSGNNTENGRNNQIMETSSNQNPEAAGTSTNSNRPLLARTSFLSSDPHIYVASYFNNDVNSSGNRSATPANPIQSIAIRGQSIDDANVPIDPRTVSNAGINTPTDNANIGTEETATSTNELYDSVYRDIVITTLRQCIHYIPFACILLVKFIYDHLLGIFDLIVLQLVMYCVNKSLQSQVVRLEEKKNSILLRDLFLVVTAVILRLLLTSASPDPFGLIIAPSPLERNIVHQVTLSLPQDVNTASQNQLTTAKQNSIERTVVMPKLISLEAIIYYIAINDLVLKLITIAIKLLVTLIPLRAIRHKSRTRLYVFIEFFSQFYRSLVPIRQWLLFLFESYFGLHAITGVMFSSTYIVLKGCELADRGKSLQKSFINLLKDVDKARRPVKDELDATDELCAICQDSYVSPVVLECGHIFCDNCVTTWFKREQTCPMCRAKVGDNLAWHDGTTTFFYQLY